MPEAKKQTTFITPLARLSYPALGRPRVNNIDPSKPPGYGATLIFDLPSIMADPKEKAKMLKLLEASNLAMKGRFPTDTFQGPFMDNTSGAKSPWLDGASPRYRDKDGMGDGKRFLRTSSNRPVGCADRAAHLIIDPDSVLYPGCYVFAYLAPFTYDPRAVKPGSNYGVGFGLRGIQFVKDGPRLDDSIDVTEAFEALEGDEADGGNTMATLESMFGAS
jgi:hypothetical protein